MPDVNFVIIGSGFIGRKHSALLEILPEANLVAIIEPHELQTEINNIPVFKTFLDFQKANIPANVAIVCSPNYLHNEHTLAFLNNNYQVICEKPLALSVASAHNLLLAAKQKNLQLYCVQQLVYGSHLTWLKEIISTNKLGKIYKIQVNAFWNRDERYYSETTWRGKKDLDGGPLFTQFSHFIQVLVWLLGLLEVKKADFYNFRTPNLTDFEDSGDLEFTFSNSGVGFIHYSNAIWDKNLESSLLLIAQKGSVKLSGQYLDNLEYLHGEDIQKSEINSEPEKPLTYYLLQEVVENIKANKPNYQSAEEALAVVKFIEEAYRFKLS